jgi:hypothetical protein
MGEPSAKRSSPGGIDRLGLRLPTASGLDDYRIRNAPLEPGSPVGALNRIAYAAAHVVVDPLVDVDPWESAVIDWDRTLAFREHLWDLGFGVAEAMDTAQRGMGLGWPDAQQRYPPDPGRR